MLSTMRRPRIHLLYGRGGGGHLASARAVDAALAGVETRLVDAAALAGAAWCDDLYGALLKSGCHAGIALMHGVGHVATGLASGGIRTAFRDFWGAGGEGEGVDLVVSFVPRLNGLMCEALRQVWEAGGRRGRVVSVVTVLTDFGNSFEHPWISCGEQWVVSGRQGAYDEARRMFPRARATKTSGMVVHPKFYEDGGVEEKIRRDGGVDGPMKVLVLFGADPTTKVAIDVVDGYRRKGGDVQVTVVCGRNRKLREALDRIEWGPLGCLKVLGFVEVAGVMRDADVLVGKPGPGVVSEAFVCGVPCVLVTGGGVMAQEKEVLDWVVDNGYGCAVKHGSEAAGIGMGQVWEKREAIAAAERNTAVFEVKKLVEGAVRVEAPESGTSSDEEETERSEKVQLPDKSDEFWKGAWQTGAMAGIGVRNLMREKENR